MGADCLNVHPFLSRGSEALLIRVRSRSAVALSMVLWSVYLAGLTYVLVWTPLAGAPQKAAGAPVVMLSLLAVTGALQAGRLVHLDRRSRRAWLLIGGGLLLFLIANVLITVLPDSEVFPSAGDYLRLASTATLLVGLHVFPLRNSDKSERLKLIIDAAVVLAGGTVIVWYFVLAPHLQNREAGIVVLGGCVYPVVDLILLFAAVRLVLRGANPTTRPSARMLAGALFLLTTIDIYESYRQVVAPGSERGNAIELAAVMTTFLLLALASVDQCRRADRPTSLTTDRGVAVSWAPYGAVALSCGLMVAEAIRDQGLSRLGGLVLGTAAIVALVLVRQLLIQRENHTLATTDPLTGLANRAKIDDVLARALDSGARNGRSTAVLLIDLDGFKQVNDTLGHQAGDELLVHFAALLSRSVLGADIVGRLGGDEFVVILDGDAGRCQALAVANRITQAMAEPALIGTTMVQPAASIGLAVTEPGEITVEDLLRRADISMYESKRHTSASDLARRRQTMH